MIELKTSNLGLIQNNEGSKTLMSSVLQQNSAFVKFSCHKNTEIDRELDETKVFLKALRESENLETLV